MVSSPTEQRVILDMTDKCLREVFSYLNLVDLCTVAEVCSRFARNAKTCFEHSRKTDLIFIEDIKSDGDSAEEVANKTEKILRHFGAYFTKFDGRDWPNNNIGHWVGESQVKCQRKIFDLLIRYCSGSLVELIFFGININDEMVPSMKALLEGLQVLRMHWIRTGQAFLDMLPQWSMNLRELRLCYRGGQNGILEGQVLRYDGFHRAFKKMEKITLNTVLDLKNHDIEEMLKRNPQLRKIGLVGDLDRGIFASIANHVPDVEFLCFNTIPSEPQDVQFFGQFRNLISLKVCPWSALSKPKYVVLFIQQIAEAHIPLKRLDLFCIDFYKNRSDASQFVGEVSKLKKLESLKLRFLSHLPTSHFYIICKNLPQLREITLQPQFALEPFFISDIIRQADKLEWFHLSQQPKRKGDEERKIPSIDSSHFKEWAEIVTKRCDRTPLDIWLCAESYTTKHKIPVRASEGAFTLLISNKLQSPIDIGNKQWKKYLPVACELVINF